ncbi:MAG: hypothetical protein RQ899_07425 [Pseudomonadales bacterium]|nr:hypothetical protein [Pseudomonadales bacterium]
MINRREFLQGSATISAASLTAHPVFAKEQPLVLRAAVIDTRFAATALFGIQARLRGLTVHEIDGDITTLWLQHLNKSWSAQPTALAGLSARPALFCLEQLAWDKGLRVIYHAEHKLTAAQQYHHTILTPLPGLDSTVLNTAGSRWPAYSAELLSAIQGLPRTCYPSQACLPASHDDDVRTLHSWVLAPLS